MSALEHEVAQVWVEAMGMEKVDSNADFFSQGGNSLHVATIIENLQKRLDLLVPPHVLFESPTVAGFAKRIELLQASTLNSLLPIAPGAWTGSYRLPASFAQRGMWAIDRLHGESAAYSIPVAFEVAGEINVDALASALDWLLLRHDSLRTCFESVDGEPQQVVLAEVDSPLTCIDLRHLDADDRSDAAVDHVLESAQRPFDLSRAPLVRVDLLLLDEQRSVLFFNVHHIIVDGRSMEILVEELLAAYQAFSAGSTPDVPEPPVRYADFTAWQYRQAEGDLASEQAGYWRRTLRRPPPLLDLPPDLPRGRRQTGRGATASIELPADLVRQVRELAQAQGCTVYNVMVAVLSVFLWRVTAQPDLIIGTPVLNRRQPELQRVLGLFVNTLALRVDLSGKPSFLDVLERVRRVTIDAFKHQELPLESVFNEVRPGGDSQQSLFQVMLAYQHDLSLPAIPGLTFSRLELDTFTSRFELTMLITERADGMKLAIEYDTDLFLPETIDRFLLHLSVLTTATVDDPRAPASEMTLLDKDEADRLAAWSRPAAVPAPARCLHRLVEDVVAGTPEAIAVVDGDLELCYRELDERASRVAQRLRELGVQADQPVGLLTNRSAATYVGILGILKAGGGYVPIDPRAPTGRIAFIVTDAKLSAVVADADNLARLDGLGVTVVDVEAVAREMVDLTPHASHDHPDTLAYVIFTSGSTGRPKGVEVTHSQVNPMLSWVRRHFPLASGDRVVQYFGYFFDGSLIDIMHPLISGATSVVAPLELLLDPSGLPEFATDHAIQELVITPMQLQAALASGKPMPTLRTLGVAGERMTDDLARRARAAVSHSCEIWNVYGPTECAVLASAAAVRSGDATEPDRATGVPIGRPFEGVTYRVLDQHGNVQPIGVPGELWIGGSGVARGYLGHPRLTAECFQPDPEQPGGRRYRTGDIVRWGTDGQLHFIGRRDHQVKIRGIRVELGEIESTLTEHPAVRDAVVVLDGERLVAYLVPVIGADLVEAAVHAQVIDRLPGHMVPSAYVAIAEVPRTANGKLDRNALPEPPLQVGPAGEIQPPTTPLEEIIAGIWAEVFGMDQLDINTDFYALGGNSLLVVDVVTRLREALSLDIPMMFMFPAPTIADLAMRIELLQWNHRQQQADPVHVSGDLEEGEL